MKQARVLWSLFVNKQLVAPHVLAGARSAKSPSTSLFVQQSYIATASHSKLRHVTRVLHYGFWDFHGF